ncbi:YceD family protein [Paenibacillus sp. CAA11]|uniref:YceD family protein n=1 Tax=Paenibacillus sp. CAA11 TaxID=1532905 RepID=UPI001F37BD12|nr:DUF177 domain-containing protein [Paenibacillus sp. CAA11]
MQFQFRKMASAEGAVQFQGELNVDHIVKGRKDIVGISPMHVDLKAYPAGEDMVEVHGELSADLNMLCSRCLKPLTRGITIDFKERFVHGQEPANEDEIDDNVNYVPEDHVDLIPFLEESLLLNVPYTMVCEDNCGGQFPLSGKDWSVDDGSSKEDRIDPRLAGLKDFFNK